MRDRNICYVLTASNMHGRPPVASRPRYNFAAAKVFNKEAFLSYEHLRAILYLPSNRNHEQQKMREVFKNRYFIDSYG